MIKVNDEVKQLARTLADWAADKSVTVFLFGSRVRGDHRPDSDVDVFVQFGAMTGGTAVWWTEQNSENFAGLKARLPGPLRILDANAALVPSVTKGKVVYRGLGYHFSMLVGGQYVARGSLRKRFGVTAQ
jgi:predicted nucleotidyltransferase